jgi:hypothetical protein
MAPTFSVETTIARPITEVWAVLTDWENAPKWLGGIDRTEADGETAIGTKLTFFARGSARSSVIADCDASRSIRLSQRGVLVASNFAVYSSRDTANRWKAARGLEEVNRGALRTVAANDFAKAPTRESPG